jgi:hypothetical protein
MKKQMNERMEALLASKSFAELTAEERYFVTETLSEKEYERMHFLAKNAPPILKATPPPNPAIRGQLLAAMRQMKTEPAPAKRPGAITRLLTTRIPAWQAAAAIAVLLAVHFLLPEKTKLEVRTETEYVYRTDTIFKEVAMPAPVAPAVTPPATRRPARVNVKPNEPSRPDLLETAIASTGSRNAPVGIRTEIPDTFALMVSQPRGQSARQTEDLWQFLGEVY